MRLLRPTVTLLALAASTFATAGLTAAGPAQAATALPNHVFAPYFEAYNGDDPAALAQQSGAKYLTMAFVQAATKGSCTVYWDGDTSTPISPSTYGSSIKTIRANGGDVIPSFGGYAADNAGTEIADSCTDVGQIAAAYENMITTYDVSRLDFDIEDNSLTDTAGIDRRNKAMKQVEDWAAANGRTVQFSYTLPTTTSGLADNGMAVLRNAVGNGARVDVVNMMTFDYYDGANHEMANDTISSANGLISELAGLYPGKSQAQLWAMVGITEMVGVDDYGPAETFTTADATTVYNWAVSKGINTLSFWALQRDNGGCPGSAASDTCSGIAQSTWQFSHAFAPFTGGGGSTPANDFSVSLSPASASVNAGASTTSSVRTAVTAGSAQSVSLSVTGAPAGVTASVSPASVTAGGNATLTVSASSSAASGSYPLTVTGIGPSGSHSATYTITVNGTTPPTGLANGDFESGALTPWTGDPGDAVVATPAHGGTHALKVNATGTQTGQASQTVTLQPNHSYTLKGWLQGNFAYLSVSGGASASTWTSSSGWTQQTVPFTTGASGTVTVSVHGWYSQGAVYADDLTIS
ncbi:glycosyl hydrolase family 18 protein [Amycolatopsis sp. PS_44_ISF1]|uniref:glycosyl hydrolase family 18 protein n=1 Tax=Amycolatopsis sp. PS_44_ISF1 TaxID=2974917 RepID=UPI0028DE798B|nr:glycosyl hydrolase family 18 protein [Amycolatopsis sp. PS_44_ISF1]MDT8915968.1 glycosyl hydrolase family 18 protein [Amycolatopsis sp. PS_44_ISF1]